MKIILKEKLQLNEEYLKPQTPYMLRNDGKLFEVKPIHPYIWYDIYSPARGEIKLLINHNLDYLKWFYDHTGKQATKENIDLLASMIVANRIYFDITDEAIERLHQYFSIASEANCDQRTIEELFTQVNDDTNQEFLRIRTSHMKVSIGDSGRVYFRISSAEFDWFDLIWQLVHDNQNFVTNVSICTDTQARGGRPYWYIHNGQKIFEMPTEEFLTLSGNPILERESSNEWANGLRKGNLLEEVIGKVPSPHLNIKAKTLWSNYLKENFDLGHRDILDETKYRSKVNRAAHYIGHVNWLNDEEDDELLPSMSMDEYDDTADKLSKEPVRTSDPNSEDDVVGYFGQDRRRIKYRKSTGEVVVYKADQDDQSTIAYYKTQPNNPASYLRKKKRDYLRELRPGDDYFNK